MPKPRRTLSPAPLPETARQAYENSVARLVTMWVKIIAYFVILLSLVGWLLGKLVHLW